MLEDDLETQPLLGGPQTNTRDGVIQPATQRLTNLPNDRRKSKNYSNCLRKVHLMILGAFFVGIAFMFITCRITTFVKHTPTVDEVQDNVFQISDVEVRDVTIDGWRESKNNPTLDNDNGKYLQVTVQANYMINYDRLQNSSLAIDPQKVENFKFVAENLVKTLCIDLNNSTTFHNVNNKNFALANVLVQNPVCVSLLNGTVTPLNVTLLVQPNMKNIMSVLKKILSHKYEGLQLWSRVSVTLYKQSIMKLDIKLATLPRVKIDWTKVFEWNKLEDQFLRYLDKNLEIPKVQQLQVTDDSEQYFDVQIQTTPLRILDKLLTDNKWIHIPQNTIIPHLKWSIRLPDCFNECTIEVPTLECHSSKFDLRQNESLTIYNRLGGPLPRELLSHVCSSDEENTVTPLTMILNELMNDSLSCGIELKGAIADMSHLTVQNEEDMLLPPDILQSFFHELDYFPISINTTFNATDILRVITIDNMRLIWSDNRLRMVGTMIASIDLAFYNTQEERLAVHNIKGNLEIYHTGTHFLSIPMTVWTKSTSEIRHDEDNNNSTFIDVTFDIKDDDMKVIDRGELSEVFNEIFFKGETRVTFDSILDVVVESVLGEVVITGLKASGETLVH
ncbi:similar to Saccharomyces cerevisiae YLR173W Putative protein of unknown function [Maudiozyma saulgeensis]|uniref:Uncharacterized protein n=1 Tax=Maudiozyma saulgeensis TaxID=1789683 RepID=A0A1X7R8L5_9SACH|nr:similar to Saccharomyces cerevisiae YLR173W Putative protein of unknown function [Kazachstania saulgeensis]